MVNPNVGPGSSEDPRDPHYPYQLPVLDSDWSRVLGHKLKPIDATDGVGTIGEELHKNLDLIKILCSQKLYIVNLR